MLSLSIIFTYMKLEKEKYTEIITTNLLPWKKKVPWIALISEIVHFVKSHFLYISKIFQDFRRQWHDP